MKTSLPLTRPTALLRRLLADERGMIVSAELMIVMTVGVLAMVTGLSSVTSALNLEYTDIANAIAGLDQSYHVSGHYAGSGNCGGGVVHGFNHGMGYNDRGTTYEVYEVQRACSVAGTHVVAEEPAVLVEEVIDVDSVTASEAQVQLEQQLHVLEAEAARLEAEVTVPTVEACPLDELEELEVRIRGLRQRLEQRDTFDCDAR